MKQIMVILIAVALCGCASTKIKDPRTKGKLLNSVERPSGPSFTIGVIAYGASGRVLMATRHEPLSFGEKTSLALGQSSLNHPVTRAEGASAAGKLATSEFGYVDVYADMTKQIISSLERNEIAVSREQPDYYIKANFRHLMGKELAGWMVWDIVMAVPSAFLPVPLVGPYDYSVQVDLYDSQQNKIDSREINTKARAVFYSFWSSVKLPASVANAGDDAVISLTLEMIREHEQKKSEMTPKSLNMK